MTPTWQSDDGSIRLVHGDCLRVLPELEAGSVDAVVTDPPYGISVKGSSNVSPRGTRNFDFFEGDDDWLAMQDLALQSTTLAVSLRPLSFVAWCGHRQIGPITGGLESAGYMTRMLYWRKKCPAPTPPRAGFTSAVETAVYGYKPGRPWNESQYEHNIFEADSYRYGQPGKVDHPTQKPLSLITWNISLLSNEGNTILDPFMGSGTTAIACIRTGRRFIGIEIDETYFNVARKRIEAELEQRRLFV